MTEQIWNFIKVHEQEFLDENLDTSCELSRLINDHKDELNLPEMLNHYLKNDPNPCWGVMSCLNENKTEYSRDSIISYFSNKVKDESTKEYRELIWLFATDSRFDDFAEQYYKLGNGFNGGIDTIMPLAMTATKKSLAEYIKGAYERKIIPNLNRSTWILNPVQYEDLTEIYTDMIGDMSVSYNVLKSFTKDFTAPVTEKLRAKVLNDLMRVHEFPEHAEFLVPIKKLTDYIGLTEEEYNTCKKLCYDNLNIQIARQIILAIMPNKDEETLEEIGNIIEKLGVKDVMSLKYLLTSPMLRPPEVNYEAFNKMLKEKTSLDITFREIQCLAFIN